MTNAVIYSDRLYKCSYTDFLISWQPPSSERKKIWDPGQATFTTSSIKTVNTTPHYISFVTKHRAFRHPYKLAHTSNWTLYTLSSPLCTRPLPWNPEISLLANEWCKELGISKEIGAWSKELSVLKAKSSALKQRVKRLLAWSKEVGATWSKEVSVKQSGWRYMKQRGWREAKRLALHEAKRLAWSKDLGVKQRPRRWSKEVGQREAKRWTWSKEVSAKQTGCMAWMRQRTHSRVRKLWVPQTNFGIFMVYFQSFKFETVQSWVHDIRIECGITKLSSFRTQIGD